MKETNTAAQTETEYPPLARDAQGNLLPIPEGTCAWRLCRQTSGRPRLINGPDKQPMRFPLETTIDELVDTCGPDTYRVYALDEVGADLGHVTTINASRELRNGAPETPLLAALRLPTAPTSDLRFALEALTQISRINGEALRSVSEAQADWVKAIAMAKGLPRNVAFPVPPPPPEDDDDDDDVPPASPAPQQGGLETFLGAVGPMMPGLYEMWRGEKKSAADKGSPATGMAHLSRIQAQLNGRERQFLEMALSDPTDGDAAAAELANRTVDDVVAAVRRKTREATRTTPLSMPPNPATTAAQETAAPSPVPPPFAIGADGKQLENLDAALKKQALAVSFVLEPSERLRLMNLAPKFMKRIAEPEVKDIVDTIVPMSVEDAAKWLRTNMADLEKRFAS